jgi:hypothetical protein
MSEAQILTDEMREFLEELRESGETNMFGAAPYLQSEFDLSRRDSEKALMEWIRSFR